MDDAVKKINAIGTVKYPDSKEAIEAARDPYDELTDEEKKIVGYENLATLAATEGYYNSIEDNSRTNEVNDLIEAIKPFEITDECKALIDEARVGYDLFTEDQKYLIKSEKDYAAAKEVVDLIDAIQKLNILIVKKQQKQQEMNMIN